MRTRTDYKPEFRKEIAEGYYTWKLSAKDIEAKGIKINNVHRWMKQIYGSGGRGPKPTEQTKAPIAERAATEQAERVPAEGDIHSLSLRKIRRGANGRYPVKDKEKAMSALLHMPVPEVAEKTGVNPATLYQWKDEAQKKQQQGSEGGAIVVLPEKSNSVSTPANGLSLARKAELIINPASTEAILANLKKSEGFVNLEKVYRNKVAAYRARIIDFDEDDHRFCMGFLQLTGGLMRGARR